MLLHSFYGKNLPITTKDIEFVEKRNIKVQELKRQMGNMGGFTSNTVVCHFNISICHCTMTRKTDYTTVKSDLCFSTVILYIDTTRLYFKHNRL